MTVLSLAAFPVPAASATAAAPAANATPACSKAAPVVRTRYGRLRGVVPAMRSGGPARACAGLASASAPNNGSPPLAYHGGPVMGTASTLGENTVTPVYWAPTGYSFPANYQAIINAFIVNVAADSGKATNTFASDTQYTQGGAAHITYKVHAGVVATDTTAFPTSGGCTHDTGAIYQDGRVYTACVTDAQLRSEVASFLAAHGLPSDLGHLYVFFFPKGVESCSSTLNGAQRGVCSINPSAGTSGGFCGYHSSPGLYASMPYAIHDSPTGYTCSSQAVTGGNEAPNGNVEADAEISILSHEMNETITDPNGSSWYDSRGNENGDDCAYIYGGGFGGGAGAYYNQTINGAHYFVQEEFSNDDWFANGANGCIQLEEAPTGYSFPAYVWRHRIILPRSWQLPRTSGRSSITSSSVTGSR